LSTSILIVADPALSEHAAVHAIDVVVVFQYQRIQIEKMCRKHFFSREQRLPYNNAPFFRHLMFDDNQKTIFCFVPKVTN
jgi:hypothetical protein